MSDDFRDDFWHSVVQCGEKFYVVMDYFLVNLVPNMPLGEPFATAGEAWDEANRRNEAV